MLYITKDRELDFEALGYHLKTARYVQVPSVRYTKVAVIGRDGDIVFKDGYENKALRVVLTAIDAPDIVTRRANARAINQELTKNGKLVLDYENDIYYNAKILEGTSVNFGASFDEVNITFDLDPIAISRIEGDLVWEDADYSWDLLNIPWEGDPFEFSVTTSDTIEVVNRGNEPSKPVIRLETTSSQDITLTKGTESFTVTALNGIINIDTRRMIVYDDTLTNVIEKFSGDYIGLDVGSNSIDVTGTVDMAFSKKDWFI